MLVVVRPMQQVGNQPSNQAAPPIAGIRADGSNAVGEYAAAVHPEFEWIRARTRHQPPAMECGLCPLRA